MGQGVRIRVVQGSSWDGIIGLDVCSGVYKKRASREVVTCCISDSLPVFGFCPIPVQG